MHLVWNKHKKIVSTERARSAAKRVSRIFAQERVKTSLWAKNSASVEANKLRSRLQEELSTEDFDKITRICDKTAENTFVSIKERHQRKFDTLAGKLKPLTRTEDSSHVNLRPAWVVNLSKRELTTDEQTVLSKGPKFAITPSLKASL